MSPETRWEDLKVYRPLSKEELKPALKDFTEILGRNLLHFGFVLRGRKLIKLSNDLFHVIHIDTRGSWTGTSEYFKIEVALIASCDTDSFVRGYELTGSKPLEAIATGIRNSYRITQEYKLMADFLTRTIITSVLPYFDKYNSSLQVLSHVNEFPIDRLSPGPQMNANLNIFCELLNLKNKLASSLIIQKLAFLKQLRSNDQKMQDAISELEDYGNLLSQNAWNEINSVLHRNKEIVFKKLKFNASS